MRTAFQHSDWDPRPEFFHRIRNPSEGPDSPGQILQYTINKPFPRKVHVQRRTTRIVPVSFGFFRLFILGDMPAN